MTTLLNFPCEFTLKVVGNSNANIEEIVVPVLQKNDVDIEQIKISSKQSKAGNYTSLTIILRADSQVQLDSIYRELSAHPQINLVL